jgi:hypothetical protein
MNLRQSNSINGDDNLPVYDLYGEGDYKPLAEAPGDPETSSCMVSSALKSGGETCIASAQEGAGLAKIRGEFVEKIFGCCGLAVCCCVSRIPGVVDYPKPTNYSENLLQERARDEWAERKGYVPGAKLARGLNMFVGGVTGVVCCLPEKVIDKVSSGRRLYNLFCCVSTERAKGAEFGDSATPLCFNEETPASRKDREAKQAEKAPPTQKMF